MKVMCMYLPQYHTFPENDEWWEPGYTEWSAVKRAVPLYKGHEQPRHPKDNRYYDLDAEAVKTLAWQARLAKDYGIYGFCIYQYWFNGKQLMEKPMETLLAHPEIGLRYSICWANETWTKTWYGLDDHILMKQEYGDEKEWEKHFYYLLPFFLDSRYIRVDNKPMFHIYRSADIGRLPEMLSCFERLAKENGLEGLYIVAGRTAGEPESRKGLVDAFYTFEPGFTLKHDFGLWPSLRYDASVFLRSVRNRFGKKKILERSIPAAQIYRRIAGRELSENVFPGIFPQWDNTPRRSYKGLVYRGATPGRFEECLRKLRIKTDQRDKDFVYVNAFNEWGEGAYLEPDEEYGYAYLEAVRNAQR